MKKLFIAILMLSFTAYAENDCQVMRASEEVTGQLEIKTDVPKFLKGATITVTLSNGQSTTVPAEKFKVVPRKQQFITTKTSSVSETVCQNKTHHRVTVLAGQAPQNGIKRDNSQAPNKVEVESKLGLEGGAQYQYRPGGKWKLLGKDLNFGGQVQTNKSAFGTLGLDF